MAQLRPLKHGIGESTPPGTSEHRVSNCNNKAPMHQLKKDTGKTVSPGNCGQPCASIEGQSTDSKTEQHVQTSGLFKLPLELRDIIYELVLTTDKPLHFRRFYGRGGIYSISNHLSTYVGTFGRLPTMAIPEFNQMKYVCRQLYYETACLELKYNAIEFRGGTGRMHNDLNEFFQIDTKLSGWTQNLTSVSIHTQVDWARIDRIYYTQVDWTSIDQIYHTNRLFLRHFFSAELKKDIGKLVTYCRDNPNVNVRWRISEFSTKLPKAIPFMAIGVALTILFRPEVPFREALLPLPSDHMLPGAAWFSSVRGHLSKGKGFPPNLKVMPGHGSDSGEFEKKFFGNHVNRHNLSIKLYLWMRDWLNIVERWHREGI